MIPGFQARRGAGLLRSLAVRRVLACLGGCGNPFQFSGVSTWSPGHRWVGSAGERPGAGDLSDRGAHRSLGAEVPCTCAPGEPAPRMGCTESRATGEPPEPEDPCAPPPETHRHLEHRQAGP